MDSLEAQIEDAIRFKKVNKAKNLISIFVSKGANEQKILLACDWYRRLSQYRTGLRLITRLNPFDKVSSKAVKLKAAEFLSSVGSIHFSRALISGIEPQTSEEFESVAAVFFAAGEYESALPLFQKRVKLLADRTSYIARATQLTQADCLAHLNKFDDAITLAKKILDQTPEELFNSIVHQAIGEYFVRSGQINVGKKYLILAQSTFPGNKETYDYALLLRWLGFADIQAGEELRGKKLLDQSTRIIRKTGLREEIWLENFLLQKLSKPQRMRLEFYPGLRQGFISKRQFQNLEIGSKKSPMEINLSSNEFRIGNKFYLGIPIELIFLAHLRVAGDWGLGIELLKGVLWPEEGHSYLYLQDRVLHLIKRIKKKYKIGVLVKKQRIYLRAGELKKIRVTGGQQFTLPKQLSTRFTLGELMEIYSLKKTQAVFWANKFIRMGLIKRQGKGPAAYYERII